MHVRRWVLSVTRVQGGPDAGDDRRAVGGAGQVRHQGGLVAGAPQQQCVQKVQGLAGFRKRPGNAETSDRPTIALQVNACHGGLHCLADSSQNH